jgi:hypothetical protein
MSGSQYMDDNYYDNVAKITKTYSAINDNLKNYTRNIDKLQDPKYEFGSGADLNFLQDLSTDKLNHSFNSPNLSDGLQRDINQLLVQENTMYIFSSIVVSSLLILAIMLGRE